VDGAVTKTGGCDGCPDSGARGAAAITGDGYAEYAPAAGHLLTGGLTADPSAPFSTPIDFAFTSWPSGAWEVREKGIYRTEGSFAAGDRLSVSVEAGAVVYRKNRAVVYTSGASVPASLTFAVTLSSAGSSVSGAVVGLEGVPWEPGAGGGSPPPPPPPPAVDLPSGVVAVGPYQAIVERQPHAEPPVPALGPAGTAFADPVFLSKIVRVTDAGTRPGLPNRSFRTPSSPHQNAWSADGSYFYLVSGDGSVIPFAFDATTGSARRLQPTATGDGGLVLKFYIEPQFSYVSGSRIYGSLSAGVNGSTLRTIDQYDFSTGLYTRLLDLDTLVPGLAGTYVGGVASSAGPVERVEAFFGGTSQDLHHYVVIFDRANPQDRLLLDTHANTLNGAPTSMALSFSLHHVAMDRSGRYVMLYPTWADMSSPRKAAQSYLWDTATGVFTELGMAALPYGHDAFGYGVSVNQDCCVSTSWDAAQWQLRNLSTPLVTRDVITSVLTPKEIYLGEHTTWNNARPDRLVPFVSGLFRSPASTTEWRAWDDEIVAIQSDAPAGADAIVWRFAHHRSDVRSDVDPAGGSFWYQPHPNISNDGRWVLFTSNWEKTLGTDPTGDAATRARQDVFLVELKSSTPPAPPVALATSSMPPGRATVPYSAALEAAGGGGAFAFAVSAGSLPDGLSLDAATGVVSGTPASAGAFTFTITVTDADDAKNSATGIVAMSIAASPVSIAATAQPRGRMTVPYAAALLASGGSGAYSWTVTGGALPPGLSLDGATGAIAGTPLAMGAYAFTVSAADAAEAANSASADVSIAIGGVPVTIATGSLPDGRERVAYAASLQALGGSGSVLWTLASGALPAGLTLDAATGAMSGVPSAAGSYALSLTATDTSDAENAATSALVVTVTPGVSVASPRNIPAAKARTFYAYQVQAASVVGTAKWNLQGGTLPPGMSISTSGVIYGTCYTKGTWYFNARVRDLNTDDTLTLTLVVK
jgi:hypothetical protein